MAIFQTEFPRAIDFAIYESTKYKQAIFPQVRDSVEFFFIHDDYQHVMT